MLQLPPHRRAPNDPDGCLSPVPPQSKLPGGAIGGALLCRPGDGVTEQIRQNKSRMPQHQQRRMQRGKNGFTNDAYGRTTKSAERFSSLPVMREVEQRQKFRQHDDDHANDENQKCVRRAANVSQKWREGRDRRQIGKSRVFMEGTNPKKHQQKSEPKRTSDVAANAQNQMQSAYTTQSFSEQH